MKIKKDRAFEHIENLSSFGVRHAESPSEEKTIDYIHSLFQQYGLSVEIESFHYKNYAYKNSVLLIDGNEYQPELIFMNPYEMSHNHCIKGTIRCIAGDSNEPYGDNEQTRNAILVTQRPSDLFRLFHLQAKAIFVVDHATYSTIRHHPDSSATLNIDGDIQNKTTYNIEATLNSHNGSPENILIVAHWDSFNGPGADDNASGVSVLLELAAYFRTIQETLPYHMKFVALGAEELGYLGAQAYVKEHCAELNQSLFIVNLDMVGGSNGLSVELISENTLFTQQGMENLPRHVQFCGIRGEHLEWILLSPRFYQITLFSDYPSGGVLRKMIDDVSSKLSTSIRYSRFDGDHKIFALTHTPTIGVGNFGNRYHCPDDIPAHVNKDSLELAGEFTIMVIEQMMKYSQQKSYAH